MSKRLQHWLYNILLRMDYIRSTITKALQLLTEESLDIYNLNLTGFPQLGTSLAHGSSPLLSSSCGSILLTWSCGQLVQLAVHVGVPVHAALMSISIEQSFHHPCLLAVRSMLSGQRLLCLGGLWGIGG